MKNGRNKNFDAIKFLCNQDDRVLHCNIEILNIFYPELQLIIYKPVIKNKSKDLLGELNKFKFYTVLVLEYNKIDDHKSMHKIFHLSTKLSFDHSDIDKAFGSMHQSVMTKIKNYVSKIWIVKAIVEHGVNIFEW